MYFTNEYHNNNSKNFDNKKKLVLEKVNGIKIFDDYFKTIMNSHFSQNIVNIKNSLRKIKRTNISFEDIEKIIINEFIGIRKTIL